MKEEDLSVAERAFRSSVSADFSYLDVTIG